MLLPYHTRHAWIRLQQPFNSYDSTAIVLSETSPPREVPGPGPGPGARARRPRGGSQARRLGVIMMMMLPVRPITVPLGLAALG